MLNLDPHQVRQAETQKQAADGAVIARLPETYQWVLVPEQKTPQAAIEWHALRLTGADALAVRVTKKLKSEELFVASLGSTILRKHLDEVPLWRGDHVLVRQLVEDFARYLYLPRLATPEILAQAVNDGVKLLTWRSDTFAYAESYDEAAARYRGLRAGELVNVSPDAPALLVKPDVAQRQMDREASSRSQDTTETTIDDRNGRGGKEETSTALRRFYGTVSLDPARVGRDAGRIAEEIIAHLAGQPGAEVTVTLEIEARLPTGASEHTVRAVTENSRTLRFTSHGFEAD